MPFMKTYDTGWNEYKLFLSDFTLYVIAYNLAYLIDNAILLLAIIKYVIELFLGIPTILHALLRVGAHLIMWMI